MTTTTHPMADKPIGQLLRQFAVPSIIAMLVSSLYNIIDQLFIGQSIGLLGNAATNIAFPLTPTCVAFSLMFGIGGAARFNLSMGAGQKRSRCLYGQRTSDACFLRYCTLYHCPTFSDTDASAFWCYRSGS